MFKIYAPRGIPLWYKKVGDSILKIEAEFSTEIMLKMSELGWTLCGDDNIEDWDD